MNEMKILGDGCFVVKAVVIVSVGFDFVDLVAAVVVVAVVDVVDDDDDVKRRVSGQSALAATGSSNGWRARDLRRS